MKVKHGIKKRPNNSNTRKKLKKAIWKLKEELGN